MQPNTNIKSGIPDSVYCFQTLGNTISFITGAIAALLYFNIGIKVFCSAVPRDVFHFPALDNRIGKFIWIGLGTLHLSYEFTPQTNKSSVPLYWAIAWVIAAAIPQLSNSTSFVSAACILQFSNIFSPMLLVGYNVQKDAMLPEEKFNSRTGQVRRVDHGIKR